MMTSKIDLPNSFVNESKLTDVKPLFHGLSPQRTMYI